MKIIICDQKKIISELTITLLHGHSKSMTLENGKKQLKNRKNCRDFSIDGGDPKKQRMACFPQHSKHLMNFLPHL